MSNNNQESSDELACSVRFSGQMANMPHRIESMSDRRRRRQFLEADIFIRIALQEDYAVDLSARERVFYYYRRRRSRGVSLQFSAN